MSDKIDLKRYGEQALATTIKRGSQWDKYQNNPSENRKNLKQIFAFICIPFVFLAMLLFPIFLIDVAGVGLLVLMIIFLLEIGGVITMLSFLVLSGMMEPREIIKDFMQMQKRR